MVIVAHQDGNHMLEVTILDLVMVLQLESVLEQPTVYYTCTSATYCGWRGCRHSSHGIERYRNCWHY